MYETLVAISAVITHLHLRLRHSQLFCKLLLSRHRKIIVGDEFFVKSADLVDRINGARLSLYFQHLYIGFYRGLQLPVHVFASNAEENKPFEV